jgi:integrase
MRREHIKDGWWQMPGEPVPALGWPGTKNGQSHRVWLPKPVQQLIGDGDTGFVFASRGGSPVIKLHDTMREICSKLAIERATPHDLRRTHGSTVTALGFGRDAMNRIQKAASPTPMTGTATPTKTSASWRRSRPGSWRWSRARAAARWCRLHVKSLARGCAKNL